MTGIDRPLAPRLWESAITLIGNRQSGMGNRGGRPPHPARRRLFFTAASPAASFPIPTIPHSRLPIPKGGAVGRWKIPKGTVAGRGSLPIPAVVTLTPYPGVYSSWTCVRTAR